ncbi:MAG: sigma factor, partial [Acidimicrobiales bacterium]
MSRDFDEFFRESYRATVRGLELDGTPSDQAHDASQEAYVRAYARWWRVGRYREPAAWVRRVAVNVVRDAHRRDRTAEAALPRLATEMVVAPPEP